MGDGGGADEGTEEPAVAQPALVHVVLAGAVHHQLGIGEEAACTHPLDLRGLGAHLQMSLHTTAHLLLVLAQARRVALHVAGVAEGGGVGWELRVLEQRLGLQVGRLKLLEVLSIQTVVLGPRIRHFDTTSSNRDLLKTGDKKVSQYLYQVSVLYLC